MHFTQGVPNLVHMEIPICTLEHEIKVPIQSLAKGSHRGRMKSLGRLVYEGLILQAER